MLSWTKPSFSRGLRAHEDHVVPRDLRERLGQLHQPAVVGPAAVPDVGVGAEHDFVPALRRRHLRGGRSPSARSLVSGSVLADAERRCWQRGRRAAPWSSSARSSAPAMRGLLLPVGADEVVPVASRFSMIPATTSIAERVPYSGEISGCWIDDGAVERAQVAPRFEVVRLRQVPVAAEARLVVVRAEVDREVLEPLRPARSSWTRGGDELVERRVELDVGRGVVDRVAAEHQQHVDVAGVHVGDERLERLDLQRLALRAGRVESAMRLGFDGVGVEHGLRRRSSAPRSSRAPARERPRAGGRRR